MKVKATNLISQEANSGLLRPKAGTKMIMASGALSDVPSDYFVHPQTGHVLPIQGNVSFDPVTSRLVFVSDSATGNLQCIISEKRAFKKDTNYLLFFLSFEKYI
jgi:hypothetical protein